MILPFLLFISLSSALGGEEKESVSLRRAVLESFKLQALIDENLYSSARLPCPQLELKSGPQKRWCPPIVLNEERDNQRRGTVGTINKLTQMVTHDRDLSSPTAVCGASPTGKNAAHLFERHFQDYKFQCDLPFSSPEQKTAAMDYISSLAVEKKAQLTKNIDDLLEAKYQLQLLTGHTPNGPAEKICSLLENADNRKACEELEKCPPHNPQRFKEEAESLWKSALMIGRLKNDLSSASDEDQKTILSSIDGLLAANPLLAMDDFKKFIDDQKNLNSQKEFEDVYLRSLKDMVKKVNQNIFKNNFSYLCLVGKSENCRDFGEMIRTSYSGPLVESPETSPQYQCIERIKRARKEADAVIDNAAFAAALNFVGAGTVLRLGKVLQNVMVGANATLASVEFIKIKPACEEKLKLMAAPSVLHNRCEQGMQRSYLKRDAEACTTQMIVAGITSVLPAVQLVSIGTAQLAKSPTLLKLLNAKKDPSLLSLVDRYLGKSSLPKVREDKLLQLEGKLNILLKSPEKYTQGEIVEAMKIMLKQCL